MSALAFVFRPAWMAAVNFGHVLALLLAVGGAWAAPRGRRDLAAVMVLAALAWPANVAASVWATTRAVSTMPSGSLAWLPFAGYLPMWVAIGVGIIAVWTTASTGRDERDRRGPPVPE